MVESSGKIISIKEKTSGDWCVDIVFRIHIQDHSKYKEICRFTIGDAKIAQEEEE